MEEGEEPGLDGPGSVSRQLLTNDGGCEGVKGIIQGYFYGTGPLGIN